MAYVYRHIRLDKNEPFYIGVGGLDEFDDYQRSRSKSNRSIFWKRIITKTKFEIEIIFDDLSVHEAFCKEIELIKLYGRKDLGLGTLCNMTDGGDGTTGRVYSHSDKTKAKIAKAHKGKIISEEVKLKLSNRLIGTKLSKEIKEKISKSHLGKTVSEETKKKQSQARQGKKFGPHSETWKLKMRGKKKCLICDERCKRYNLCKNHQQITKSKKFLESGKDIITFATEYKNKLIK